MRTGVASEVFQAQVRSRRWAWLAGPWRAVCGLGKGLFGAACAVHPLTAVLLLGWMSRVMQRTACHAWWRQVPRPYKKMIRFREAAQHMPGWGEWANWPNWLLSQQPLDDLRRVRLHRLLRGLWENVRRGVEMLATTAAALILPLALLALAWHARSAAWAADPELRHRELGPFSLVAGLPFVLVMFHVPMAQARQAVSGEWRRFFDFSLVRRVVRRRWLRCTLLAVLHAAVIVGLRGVSELPPVHAAVWIFLAASLLRWLAATIYASAISHMLATGEVKPAELSPAERLAFPPELIANPAAAERWTRRDAVLAWTLSAPFRIVCALVVAAAWATAVASVASGAHSAAAWTWWPTLGLPAVR